MMQIIVCKGAYRAFHTLLEPYPAHNLWLMAEIETWVHVSSLAVTLKSEPTPDLSPAPMNRFLMTAAHRNDKHIVQSELCYI